jgi:hypothetical protein
MAGELVYYKVNAAYPVGVRWNVRDTIGRVLSLNDPYVAVKADDLRDFRRANYFAIEKGLIIATDEPSMEIESPNMIDDEKAYAIVKNELALKKALKEITSVSMVVKLLTAAQDLNRSAKTIKLIEARIAEFEAESPFIMKGVDND